MFNKFGTSLAQSGLPWGAMLRKISLIYAAVSFTGSALLKAKPEPVEKADPLPEEGSSMASAADDEFGEKPSASFREAISSKRFALLWAIGLMAFTPGLTVTGLYKRFGMSDPAAIVADDSFQSLVGGFAAITSGFGRVFWGGIVDKIGFQKGYSATTCLQLFIM